MKPERAKRFLEELRDLLLDYEVLLSMNYDQEADKRGIRLINTRTFVVVEGVELGSINQRSLAGAIEELHHKITPDPDAPRTF